MTFNDAVRRAVVIVALSAAALVAGCSFTRPAPVKESYLLEPALPEPAAGAKAASLRVGTVSVSAPFRGRSFVVRESEFKFESDFYREFFVPPGVMVAESTARALARGKVFADVTRPGVVVDTDWVLDAFVGALYADARDAGKAEAVMQVTYYLSRDDGGSSAPVWSHAYIKRVAFTSTNTGAYVSALNSAFSEILSDLIRDLAAAELPAK